MIARPLILGYKERKYAKIAARTGDFADSTLRSMADAIRANDATTLARLLNRQPPPAGKDLAGNDLLAFALIGVRDGKTGIDVLRALLDAGADARSSRTEHDEDVVNFMMLGSSDSVVDAVRLLLDHGADPNAVDRSGDTPLRRLYNGKPELVRLLVDHGADIDRVQSDGVPAIVNLIGNQQWEAALDLVEKGAKLDVQNADGLSVDYYLNEWKESVNGEHPEGWDKLREAIERRRAAPSR
jgi:ankyrin repeat protein